MEGRTECFSSECLNGFIYLPPGYRSMEAAFPAVYVNGGDGIRGQLTGIIEALEPKFGISCEPFLLVGMTPGDWNRDFTPWEAPALSEKQPSFGGGADTYLALLTEQWMPEIERKYPVRKGEDVLLGYSLGGLVSLYALYRTSVFRQIASLSGSLWFDGWIDYMKAHRPRRDDARVYLSLGSAEGKTKNPRMKAVSACTEEAKQLLEQQLPRGKVLLEWNHGGHFSGIPQRYVRALQWLMKKQ